LCKYIYIYIKFGENILTLIQIILIKDHSWRHIEFKKYSKKSGNLLYCNTALTSYTREQYSAAVQALQNIFCKKDNKVNFDKLIIFFLFIVKFLIFSLSVMIILLKCYYLKH
jgi:hypothetical protein